MKTYSASISSTKINYNNAKVTTHAKKMQVSNLKKRLEQNILIFINLDFFN